MESLKHDEFFKNRGLGATLKAAYNKYLARFQFVLKHLWPAALVYAVFVPLLMILCQPNSPGGQPSLWMMIVGFVLAVVAEVVLYSRISQLLNNQTWKWNVGRIIKLTIVAFCIHLLVGVIIGVVWALAWLLFAPESSTTPVEAQLTLEQVAAASLKIMSVVCLVSLVIGLLMVPFAFSFTKYVVDTQSRVRDMFFRTYKQGLRHWGYIFVTLVVSGLLMSLVVVLFCLPLIIIYMALFLNVQGMAQGDASGLPGGFLWLVYFVTLATCFVLSFVVVFFAYVCYYMYGTVETREKERETGHRMSEIKLAEEGV